VYVIAEQGGGMILAFGLTPEKADADLIRRRICYDGPPLEMYRSSPALYRIIKAKDKDRSILSQCRINNNGVAVLLRRIRIISRRHKG
jgi:hypothetical protein